MRIDQVNRVNQVYSTKSINKTKPANKTNKQDSLAISQIGRDMQIAKQALGNTSEVRMDRINSVKAKLTNNEYEMNLDKIVDELVTKLSK